VKILGGYPSDHKDLINRLLFLRRVFERTQKPRTLSPLARLWWRAKLPLKRKKGEKQ
jgi:hypothetical protein